ncbi:MAG: HD domain-containing protein [Chloroflexi bacterium]|nr:HD domain-containing protein [Chloroflexota bacterium]
MGASSGVRSPATPEPSPGGASDAARRSGGPAATMFGRLGVRLGRMLDPDVDGDAAPEADTVSPEREQLIALAIAAESRDMHAGEHLRRLELLSRRLAEHAGLDALAAAEVGWAAMVHDIGKLRVPDHVLLKPDPLSREEWAVVRLHPIWSEQALGDGAHLAVAREVARSHHENWDGSGYPDGLYGDRIPLAARIVRITDAFDAMTNRRPYQAPVSIEAALEELQATAGHDFDPELVRRFGDLIRSDARLRGQLMPPRPA